MITVSNVANASRGELLCITYELLLEHIKGVKESFGEEKQRHLSKALEILQMLVGDLNFEYELSKELFRIYVYVQGLLVKNAKDDKLDEAYKLINKLYVGFQEANKNQIQKKPCIENAEVIYAGLTYGPDDLKELSVSKPNRGFKA